jgi:hypothetical protein
MSRRALPVALAVAVCLSLSACGESEAERQAAASSSAQASEVAAADARRIAQNEAAAASSSAAAASSSRAAAAASASAAAEAAAPKPPTVFTGSGDDVVTITKPAGATVVIATITGNDAGRYFGVKAVDGDMDTLVNTTDPYNGTTLLDANRGGTTQLQVQAVGPWSITLTDMRSAPTFTSAAPQTGAGDAVLIYQGSRGVARIQGNAEGRYFGVKAYGSGGAGNSLVNTTDPYTGSVPMPAGPAIVVVTANGDWSIDVN